jgi:hypothetical protein
MSILTQTDLNKFLRCDCGREHEHEPLCIHADCHPNSPLWPWYFGGIIVFRCSKCNDAVATIKVAKE